jgi:hypothetical protein
MNMRIIVLPKSFLGKWAVGLAATFILLLVLSGVLTGLGGMGPGLFGPILGVAFGVSGLGALATGVISVLRGKDRSILVLLALALGLFTLIFLLGELLIPH